MQVPQAAAWLCPLQLADARHGGKAAQLAALLGSVEPWAQWIPPGIAVACEAYRHWAAAENDDKQAVAEAVAAAVLEQLARMRAHDGRLHSLVVRSSATSEDAPGTTSAGVFESVTGVQPTLGALTRALTQVWHSAMSPTVSAWRAAAAQRREHAAETELLAMGVIVQLEVLGDRCTSYATLHAARALQSHEVVVQWRTPEVLVWAGASDVPWPARLQRAFGGDAAAFAKMVADIAAALEGGGARGSSQPCDSGQRSGPEPLRGREQPWSGSSHGGGFTMGAGSAATWPVAPASRRLDCEWILTPTGAALVQARFLPAHDQATRDRTPLPPMFMAFSRKQPTRRWTFDRAHNPEPLSVAQQELVQRVEDAGLGAYALRTVAGYLYAAPRETSAEATSLVDPDAAGDVAANGRADRWGTHRADTSPAPSTAARASAPRSPSAWLEVLRATMSEASAAQTAWETQHVAVPPNGDPLGAATARYLEFYARWSEEVAPCLRQVRRAVMAAVERGEVTATAVAEAMQRRANAPAALLLQWERWQRAQAAANASGHQSAPAAAMSGPEMQQLWSRLQTVSAAWDVASPTWGELLPPPAGVAMDDGEHSHSEAASAPQAFVDASPEAIRGASLDAALSAKPGAAHAATHDATPDAALGAKPGAAHAATQELATARIKTQPPGRDSVEPPQAGWCAVAAELAFWEEEDDYWFYRAQAEVRACLLALAENHDLGDEVFWIPWSLLQTLAPSRANRIVLQATADGHRAAARVAEQFSMPETIVDGRAEFAPTSSSELRAPSPRDDLAANANASNATDANDPLLALGRIGLDIAVVEHLTPASALALRHMKGIICATGGPFDHGAAMAHALALPLVVGARGFEALPPGTLVALYASGTVRTIT